MNQIPLQVSTYRRRLVIVSSISVDKSTLFGDLFTLSTGSTAFLFPAFVFGNCGTDSW